MNLYICYNPTGHKRIYHTVVNFQMLQKHSGIDEVTFYSSNEAPLTIPYKTIRNMRFTE